ncbi:MAG: hypothetical protein KDA27_22270, partial [Candidatus Eisenbacteria bacterium]|nr:hypothetical protein [Candidatus Eisenbacteria bacterium]
RCVRLDGVCAVGGCAEAIVVWNASVAGLVSVATIAGVARIATAAMAAGVAGLVSVAVWSAR